MMRRILGGKMGEDNKNCTRKRPIIFVLHQI
jgi:hypothetical protein